MRRHAVNDRFNLLQVGTELLAVDLLCQLPHSRHHLQQVLNRAKFLKFLQLIAKVLKIKLAACQPLFHRQRIFFIDAVGGPLDESKHVAHAKDAPRQPVRVERLETVHLLACAKKLDRHTGYLPDAERSAASCVAIDLRHDQSGHRHARMETLGDRDRFLTGHRVHHQQDIRRAGNQANLLQLLHHRLINLQAAGRVKNQDRVGLLSGAPQSVLYDAARRNLGPLAVNRNVNLASQCLQLRDGRRPVDVSRDHQGALSLLAKPQREFGRHRRLARALQTHQHDHRGGRTGKVERRRLPQQGNELFVDDLDDLLRRRQAFHHLYTDRPLFDSAYKLPDNLVVDISFQQGQPHFPQGSVNIALRKPPAARQILEYALQLVRQTLKHEKILVLTSCRPAASAPNSYYRLERVCQPNSHLPKQDAIATRARSGKVYTEPDNSANARACRLLWRRVRGASAGRGQRQPGAASPSRRLAPSQASLMCEHTLHVCAGQL